MTDIADLELRIARLEAAREIENLMGRFESYHAAYRNELIPAMFADRDDLIIEMPFGTYLGRDAARRVWRGALTEDIPPTDLSGEYVEHLLTTPVIEVAKDGMTAKAAWISPGAEAHHFGWEEGNPLKAFWYWGRYNVDFIKEDGAWKIWHLTHSATFITDYHHSYAEPEHALSTPPAPSGRHAPDAPPRGQVPYSPTFNPGDLPVAPEPYDTYEGV
ncbi:nuclear transport factor 2 family protein [Nonomuraea turkmeniaca]|uniref:Nuclear transport factor 2 family protein n=1 Tax=Nonomuraea turkmeniaca TaxID=103838 RepID=A0A5S4FXV4_9ACTN|nr:nuclear transport factor 2 family protein [Nonomuraea turkmeniaca]TMR24941.1 nuclear transport factor 2 family protein [Nonomuraea turkmeniaca]